MAIEFKLESDVGEIRVAPKRVAVEQENASTIAKQVIFKTDSYESMDHLYASAVNVSRDYYKAFKEGYGQFLIQHSNALKEAENLAPRDKEYRLLKLKSSMINEITRLAGDPHFRVYIEACQKFYNDKTRLISSINPIKEALDELRLGFSKEIKGNLPEEFQKVEIYERNANGIPTGNKISLSEIFTNGQTFLKYINDPQVKNFFIHLSENVVDPKLNEIIISKEKAVSEEVKSLAMPVYKAMVGVAVPMAAWGIGHTLIDSFGRNYHSLDLNGVKTILNHKQLIKNATDTVFQAHNGFPQLLNRAGHLGIDGITKGHMHARITHHLASDVGGKLSGNLLTRTANRAVAHALLQGTASQGAKGVAMVGWRAIFGVGSRALGFLGGPIGLAASLILPFAIDLVIAEARDAFTVASGRESKNHGYFPIGEWFGSCFQDIGRSFS